jgi:hypothetical protein
MAHPVAFDVCLHGSLPMVMLPTTKAIRRVIFFQHVRAPYVPMPAQEPVNAYPAQGRIMRVYVSDECLTVVLVGLMRFDLFLTESRIECLATESASLDQIRYWLLGQILPMFLLFDGSTELLHAAASMTENGAVAFLGCSGVGKSTLLDHCLKQGGSLITDEHLALSRKDYAQAIPSLPLYRPYRSIEDLGIPAAHFSPDPVNLRRLYLLHPAPPDAPVSFGALTSSELIASVLNNRQYNVFNQKLAQFYPLMKQRFAGLAHVARTIRVRRLFVPRSTNRLPEVYRFIQEDLARDERHSALHAELRGETQSELARSA